MRICVKIITFTFLVAYGFLGLLAREVLAAGASLTPSPASGTYQLEEVFEVKVELNTGGARTAGVDTYLFYDPEKLEAQKITPGTVYSQYVAQTIDSENGIISISGLIGLDDQCFSGTGTFATLQFKGLKAGATELRFDFTPSNRNDSNVAGCDNQLDILDGVSNGSYTIKSLILTPTSTLYPTPTISPVPTVSTPIPTSTEVSSPTSISTPTPTPEVVSQSKKGDVDQDSKVDVFDLSRLLSKWGKTDGIANVDLNNDGRVDIFDLSVLLSNWSK